MANYVALTPRQLEIARLICDGLSRKQIAAHLGINPTAFDSHRIMIMRRTRCDTAPQLVRYAVNAGWIEPIIPVVVQAA